MNFGRAKTFIVSGHPSFFVLRWILEDGESLPLEKEHILVVLVLQQ
jgi:hypothetical protein